jgi:peptidoglycan/xylan/chitin deacetylase (PgdA/CDA1 family)
MITFKNYSVNLVMYHYIKPYNDNKILNLKVLDVKKFQEQILYFKNKYNILNNDEFCEIIHKKKIPKRPSVFLTFDDGYKDHYDYVYPLLLKHKVSGVFYPVAKNFYSKTLLDVNKIQLILGRFKDKDKLLKRIFYFIKKYTKKKYIELNIKSIILTSRFDSKVTILIKRLLQYQLHKSLRKKIINSIFSETFDYSDINFFKNFYLNSNNALEMFKDGMSFGIHGYNHYWMQHLNQEDQEKEITSSINLLKKIQIFNKNMSVCYPYGGYNYDTINIIKKLKIKFAITVQKGNLNYHNINDVYKICRFDCNDLLK